MNLFPKGFRILERVKVVDHFFPSALYPGGLLYYSINIPLMQVGLT